MHAARHGCYPLTARSEQMLPTQMKPAEQCMLLRARMQPYSGQRHSPQASVHTLKHSNGAHPRGSLSICNTSPRAAQHKSTPLLARQQTNFTPCLIACQPDSLQTPSHKAPMKHLFQSPPSLPVAPQARVAHVPNVANHAQNTALGQPPATALPPEQHSKHCR